MDQIIERVARAMCRTHWPDEERWKVYKKSARAAIAAMRVPSQEMVHAAIKLERVEGKNIVIPSYESSWGAMVDAALQDDNS